MYVHPYDVAMDPDFILMDDNARPKRARVINEYLQTAAIKGMDWTAMFSDLNSIGHAWDIPQTAISDRSANQGCRAPTGTTRPMGSNPKAKYSKANKNAMPSSNQVK